ncbi:MAG: hypothetical protein Q7T11_00435 [Deltaproteobacteria bacterium]|nr:hypothetical protein [Deltaproteobacteria bacterium]
MKKNLATFILISGLIIGNIHDVMAAPDKARAAKAEQPKNNKKILPKNLGGLIKENRGIQKMGSPAFPRQLDKAMMIEKMKAAKPKGDQHTNATLADWRFVESDFGTVIYRGGNANTIRVAIEPEPALPRTVAPPNVSLHLWWHEPDALAFTDDWWGTFTPEGYNYIDGGRTGWGWSFDHDFTTQISNAFLTAAEEEIEFPWGEFSYTNWARYLSLVTNTHIYIGWIRMEIDPENRYPEGADGEENNVECGMLYRNDENSTIGVYALFEGLPCEWDL